MCRPARPQRTAPTCSWRTLQLDQHRRRCQCPLSPCLHRAGYATSAAKVLAQDSLRSLPVPCGPARRARNIQRRRRHNQRRQDPRGRLCVHVPVLLSSASYSLSLRPSHKREDVLAVIADAANEICRNHASNDGQFGKIVIRVRCLPIVLIGSRRFQGLERHKVSAQRSTVSSHVLVERLRPHRSAHAGSYAGQKCRRAQAIP